MPPATPFRSESGEPAGPLAPGMGPARCPECGERQNVAQGEFDPAREPFGPLNCMVCGHTFTRREFVAGLAHGERRSHR